MLGAVFLASEYGSTPKTTGGKVIFGAGCGVLTVLFRYFLPTYDGVCLAIFIASLFSRPLDKLLRPAPYGTFIRREEAKEKEKEKGSAEKKKTAKKPSPVRKKQAPARAESTSRGKR